MLLPYLDKGGVGAQHAGQLLVVHARAAGSEGGHLRSTVAVWVTASSIDFLSHNLIDT